MCQLVVKVKRASGQRCSLRRKGLLATRVGARHDRSENRSTPFQTASQTVLISVFRPCLLSLYHLGK